jgi:hypothetical protein
MAITLGKMLPLPRILPYRKEEETQGESDLLIYSCLLENPILLQQRGFAISIDISLVFTH